MASTTTVRRARGMLEDLVREVCDLIAEGKLVLDDEDARWTPHRLAREIGQRYPGSGVAPSTGAIADNLKRWRDLGFAEVTEDPLAFVDYTDAARSEGLTALKEQARQRRSAARAEERRARKDAETAAAVAAAQAAQAANQSGTGLDGAQGEAGEHGESAVAQDEFDF